MNELISNLNKVSSGLATVAVRPDIQVDLSLSKNNQIQKFT